MDSPEDVEEDYGLIRPTLIKTLRGILDQYPDDGQILKELIQNAEDAGARQVKFLYDDNVYGTRSLHHPEMAQYQGPALLAYNDAMFAEDDWRGIRMLQDSIKEKDPMKVGRFGLGFKSVLHMTDLPSVLSGELLQVIDPHERFFSFNGEKSTGYRWHLREKQDAMNQIPNQFEPYQNAFGCSKATFKNGSYDGTMFRFPLRTTPNALSDTLYDGAKINELFESFRPGAHTLLLFLKNLESVELLKQTRGNKKPEKCFAVQIAPSCLENVRQHRRKFAEKIKNREYAACHVNYAIEIETLTYNGDKMTEKNSYRYLVNNFYAGGETSVEFQKLCKDNVLGYVPLVGTAMPYQMDQDYGMHQPKSAIAIPKDAKVEDNEENNAIGQVFCFLPLPVEQRSSTGLPVHVNGYFSISQNRRHLKWPTEGHKHTTDKALLWNMHLLAEAVPKSYASLIKFAIDFVQQAANGINHQDIYRALPNLQHVDEKWQVILEPLFDELFRYSLFYTPSSGGKWLKADQCVFDCLHESETVASAIRNYLIAVEVPVSKPPQYIYLAFGYCDILPELIEPALLRHTMRRKAQYKHLDHNSKLALMTFALKDFAFEDMHGLELLPVSDNSFICFESNTSASRAFVCTDTCPRVLLPGKDNVLVPDFDDENLTKKFNTIAKEGHCNVQMLDEHMVLSMLREIMPGSWKGKSVVTLTPDTPHVSYTWLRAVWDFLRHHFPSDLSPASDLHLLPLDVSEDSCPLVPLTLPSSVISASLLGTALPKAAAEFLSSLDIHVVRELPDFVTAHGAVIGNYVHLALESDVLEVLQLADTPQGRVAGAIREATEEQISALISILCKLNEREVNPQAREFLGSLPLFKVISPSCSGVRVCVQEVNQAAPDHNLPITLEDAFLKIETENEKALAVKLGVVFINAATLLRQSILPKITQRFIANDQIQDIMTHVLDNMHDYTKDDPSLISYLANVPFVVTSTGNPMKPCELFDPESNLLRNLFAGENIFPCGQYTSSERLMLLRKMKLKGEKDITPKDVMHAAMRVEDMSEDERDPSKKACALVQFICSKEHYLNQDVNGRYLREWLADVAWVPVLREKVPLYPKDLEWLGKDFYTGKPNEMVTKHLAFLGSHKLVCSEDLPFEIGSAIGFTSEPDVDVVISQLQSIVTSYNVKDKAAYLAQLNHLYNNLAKRDPANIAPKLQNVNNWIWMGDGFASVGHVYVRLPLDLKPYTFPVPLEMQPFVPLFAACGVKEDCGIECLIKVLEYIHQAHQATVKAHNEGARGVSGSAVDPQVVNVAFDESSTDTPNVEHDLQLAVDVLNKLGAWEKHISDEQRAQILFPVNPVQRGDTRLTMLPVDDVTYCDVEWMRKGFDVMQFDADEDGIYYMHDLVPMTTAHALRVPTLLSRMLHAQELDITGYGQSEPLTDRLKALLNDYTDGLSIPKELIQNADDAKATEVAFLYDERSLADQQKFLIDEGMRECQGPALWVYNNATFTDEDFENIVKLGGATKEAEVSKIGKFGLGFNAVYNVTDVPSFISRDSIVVFDPHTTHLGRAIRDRSKPGIKIDIKKNKTLLRKLSHQFSPYENIFGCQIAEGTPYDGTLFRLPLRNEVQAQRSKICQRAYNRSEVLKLLQMSACSGHNLLLFTQNVLRVSFYHMSDESKPSLLYEIKKEPVKIVRELSCVPPKLPDNSVLSESERHLVTNSNFLSAVSQYNAALKKEEARKLKGGPKVKIPPVPQSTLAIKTVPNLSPLGTKILSGSGLPEQPAPKYWIVSSYMGQGSSFTYANENPNLHVLPIGGVALPIKPEEDGFIPHTEHFTGHVFCYLPIPMLSGLPVHVNGTWALNSSRRTLHVDTVEDKDKSRSLWNKVLMEDAVVEAYLQALSDINQIFPTTGTTQVRLFNQWPRKNGCPQEFLPIVVSFYQRLMASQDVTVTHDVTHHVTLAQTCFVDYFKLGGADGRVIQAAISAFNMFMNGQRLMEIPNQIINSFKQAQCEDLLRQKTYDAVRFFRDVFLSHIGDLDPSVREILLMHALDLSQKNNDDAETISKLLKETACIPVQPNGTVFKKPRELINPTGVVAKMFDVAEHRFPYGRLTDFRMIQALKELGMTNDIATWDDLCDRTRSVCEKFEQDVLAGEERLQSVFVALNRKINNCKFKSRPLQRKNPLNICDEEKDMHEKWAPIFRQTSFLPTMKKPAEFPVTWLGETHNKSDESFKEENDTENMDVDTEEVPLENETKYSEENENNENIERNEFRSERRLEHSQMVTSATQGVSSANGSELEPEEEDWCPSLMSAEEMYPFQQCALLVSSTQPIVDNTRWSPEIRQFFGIENKQVTLEQVITQAQHAFEVKAETLSDGSYKWLLQLCGRVYEYLQGSCQEDENIIPMIQAAFTETPCVLLNHRFVKPELVSFSFYPRYCDPYLYGVPREMIERFKPILQIFGVKNFFSIEDYVSTLKKIHEKYDQCVLNKRHLEICVAVAGELKKSMVRQKVKASEVVADYGAIYVPNVQGILHPAPSLCVNDCTWVNHTANMNYVHKDFPPSVCEVLGVKTKRQTKLKDHSRGIPFGQRGSLLTSIKRIIEHYPADHEILKELIQNADDAGATEVTFILDMRDHPTNSVFEKSWKPLQGPALLVHNNSTFSEEDIMGIQRLGEGSKQSDPLSTGQYGIGFTSVYHLTDAPSFLTTTKERGHVLCALDPQCLYVPNATEAEPGIMYDDIDMMRDLFPDVFNCYLPDTYPEGTTFRFPLRTRIMAETSKISNKVVDRDTVVEMLKKLKHQLFDVMLFTKSVKIVRISTVDITTGNVENQYVAISRCPDDTIHTRLSDAMKGAKEVFRQPEVNVKDIERNDILYRLSMHDTEKNSEEWCVAVNIGLRGECEIPESVSEAIADRKLALLPLGGVAVCLKKRNNNSLGHISVRPQRIFCSLPLPQETQLPVHINAHFALSSESRKTVFVNNEESVGCKQDWNELLLKYVVAPAYVQLLSAIRFEYLAHFGSDSGAGPETAMQIPRSILEGMLNTYQGYFPLQSQAQGNSLLELLVNSTYEAIAESEACILPSIIECPPAVVVASPKKSAKHPTESKTRQQPRFKVKWFPSNGKGSQKAFFCKKENLPAAEPKKPKASATGGILKSLTGLFTSSKPAEAEDKPPEKSEAEILKEVLFDCGFNLLDATSDVIDGFLHAEVQIDLLSPEGVLVFFKSYGTEHQSCDVGDLPCKLNQSKFNNLRTLKTILKYCKGQVTEKQANQATGDPSIIDTAFANAVDGTPLLLLNDDTLTVFNSDEPVFLSTFSSLLPSCGNLFLSDSIRSNLFQHADPTDSHVFRPFTIEELAMRLPEYLDKDTHFQTCNDENLFVPWSPITGTKVKPRENWVKLLWTFIRNELKEILNPQGADNQDKDEIKMGIKEKLEPIEDWAVLPISFGDGKMGLTSIGNAHKFVHISRSTTLPSVEDSLSKLKLPEVRKYDIENSTVPRHPNWDTVRHLVATVESPKSILILLQSTSDEEFQQLRSFEASHLLDYFAKNIEELKKDEENAEKLASLPLYKTVCGDLIRLTGCFVYTVPAQIPTDGMDAWQNRSGTVFLEEDAKLKPIYDYLDCKAVTPIEVYRDFIFAHFEMFDPAHRAVHVQHVYNTYVGNIIDGQPSPEQMEFQEVVKDLPFIEDEDGELQPASLFYDPKNPIFKALLPDTKFPPKASEDFDEEQWYELLRGLGLVKEVTNEMYVQFVHDVASLQDGSEETENKSRVLVKHLFGMSEHDQEATIQQIRNVPFIRPYDVDDRQAEIAPQYGRVDDQSPLPNISFQGSILTTYDDLVWTSANLLPPWANPKGIRTKKEDEKQALMLQLGIEPKPSVELVATHLGKICDTYAEDTSNGARMRHPYLQRIYEYLQKAQVQNNTDVTKRISRLRCVVVDGGTELVRPTQCVMNMVEDEEVRPYLYRLPAELGKYQQFFESVGAQQVAKAAQYVQVLSDIKEKVKKRLLHPNEVAAVMKTMKGLFQALQNKDSKDIKQPIYLLSNSLHLVNTRDLVYNDSPAFFGRVPDPRLKFLIDLRQCEIKNKAAEDTILLLPVDYRLQLLSELVVECAVEEQARKKAGLAKDLEAKVNSEQFQNAIRRLVKHNAAKSGRQISDIEISEQLSKLGMIELYSMKQLRTHLMYKNQAIPDSETQKTCFVSDNTVYIEEKAGMNPELLIPLSECINGVLGGILRESVLFVIPLLQSTPEDMNKALNRLNIKEDEHTDTEERVEPLPTRGTPVTEEHARYLFPGHNACFHDNDWAAYQRDETAPVQYCQIIQNDGNGAYVISLGDDIDLAPPAKLFKFE